MAELPKLDIQPAVDERAGTLKHGLRVAGRVVKDFAVGPLTHAAEMASLADIPDWIDAELVYQVSLLAEHDDSLTPVEKTRKAAAQALPPARRTVGLVMLQAVEGAQLPFRVTRLGGIPKEQIPAAFKLLVADDRNIIQTLAGEVDAELTAFPEKSKGDDAPGPDSVRVESGNDAPSGPPAGNGGGR